MFWVLHVLAVIFAPVGLLVTIPLHVYFSQRRESEERRHREIVEAIRSRAAKPEVSPPTSGFDAR